jgi:hypothetical protein
MRLSLAPACAHALHPCLTFEARTTPYSVVVMADSAIRGNIWEPHVIAALRAMNIPLTALNTPLVHRLFNPGARQTIRRTRGTSAGRQGISLRRALHNDRAKIHVLTQNATEQKLTDPAIATAVRNLQRSNALQDIPTLHPDKLPHLLSSNWCFDPVYSGPSRKADAIHIGMFLKSSTGAVKTVLTIDDLHAIGETMKLTFKTIAVENEEKDFQFYDRLLTRTSHKILQDTEGRSVRQINKLYTEWAKLYKSEKYDRDDDRAPRNGTRDYHDRDAHNRPDVDKKQKAATRLQPDGASKPGWPQTPSRPSTATLATSPGTSRLRRYLHSQPIPPRGSCHLQTPLHSQALSTRSQPAAPQRETRGRRQESGTREPATHGR